MNRYERSEILLGPGSTSVLRASSVAVIGLGGVGSYAAEALARSGIGRMLLVDADVICRSNINRQLFALESTLGMPKAEVAAARINDIDPAIKAEPVRAYVDAEVCDRLGLADFDYVVDAVDSVEAKVLLAVRCRDLGVPIISCMGAGNRLDPTQFRVCDIYSTSNDPLARVMRSRLRRAGVDSLKVVCSALPPLRQSDGGALGSVPFVPSVAGLLCAREVVLDMLRAGGIRL